MSPSPAPPGQPTSRRAVPWSVLPMLCALVGSLAAWRLPALPVPPSRARHAVDHPDGSGRACGGNPDRRRPGGGCRTNASSSLKLPPRSCHFDRLSEGQLLTLPLALGSIKFRTFTADLRVSRESATSRWSSPTSSPVNPDPRCDLVYASLPERDASSPGPGVRLGFLPFHRRSLVRFVPDPKSHDSTTVKLAGARSAGKCSRKPRRELVSWPKSNRCRPKPCR